MLAFPKPVRQGIQRGIAELQIPYGGVNLLDPLINLPTKYAYTLNNFDLFTDRLARRYGTAYHITSDFVSDVKRLHTYTAVGGTATLWATTANGVFDVTASGAAPAASIALTNGVTQGAILSTGAQNYLILVNGADSMVIYDGATWAATATVGGGAINTNTFSYVEVYRQRVFFVVENTTRIVYLNANTPTGGGTNYDLAAIFRKGGYIVALGTWTIDGGTGPDDHLVIVTSEGEVAVFAGNDPATWAYKGTYFIAPPLGVNPLYKWGGDLLYICASGVYPLSKALLNATINRTAAITARINPVFSLINTSGSITSTRWQLLFNPLIPCLMVNTSAGAQWNMNTQTGGWFSYSSTSYVAENLAFFSSAVYIAHGKRVAKFTAPASNAADIGAASITYTYATGYINMARGLTYKIQELQPVIQYESIGGAPPPGAVEVGSLGVSRIVGGYGTQVPTVPLTGGTIPSRTDERWYTVYDDFSQTKQIQMTWNGAFAYVPLSFYKMGVSYIAGQLFNPAGRATNTV